MAVQHKSRETTVTVSTVLSTFTWYCLHLPDSCSDLVGSNQFQTTNKAQCTVGSKSRNTVWKYSATSKCLKVLAANFSWSNKSKRLFTQEPDSGVWLFTRVFIWSWCSKRFRDGRVFPGGQSSISLSPHRLVTDQIRSIVTNEEMKRVTEELDCSTCFFSYRIKTAGSGSHFVETWW